MRFTIGIDDTDQLGGPGTSHRASELAERLRYQHLAETESITRHQLLTAPEISYTKTNSSVCLVVAADPDNLEDLITTCRAFLVVESAPGSNPGLCAAAWVDVHENVQAFGEQATREVVAPEIAVEVARRHKIYLEGITGTGSGVIGALAAVGLRVQGQRGRFSWLPGLRELSPGVYTVRELLQQIPIDDIQSLEGISLPEEAGIEIGLWNRPVLKKGKSVLLVEKAKDGPPNVWHVVPKEIIKQRYG